MGMFDFISVSPELLPVIPELVGRELTRPFHEEFQTKDLDCSLKHYRIDGDSRLRREDVETVFEENTVEETDLGRRWNPPFIEREISREWVDDDFSGTINIYNRVIDKNTEDSIWVEYNILLIKGVLDSIKVEQVKVDLGTDIAKRAEEWKRIWDKRDNDYLYQFCNFLSLKVISKLIHYLNCFDKWIRTYQPK